MPAAIEAFDVHKTYQLNRIHAVDGIDFRVDAGEVVGIVGENGSGKSTLVSILGSVQDPDRGTVLCRAPVCLIPQSLSYPRDRAWRLFSLLRGAGPVVVPKREMGRLDTYGRRFGIRIDGNAHASSLSPVDAFFLELYGGLDAGARIFLLDEPAPFLSGTAGPLLGQVIGHLARTGASVVVVSHKLEAVRRACDRIVIMERGKTKLEADARSIEAGELAELAYARRRESAASGEFEAPHKTPPQTRVDGHKTAPGVLGGRGGLSVDVSLPDGSQIAFTAAPGQVTAVVQRVGSGAYELEDALVGLPHPFSGRIGRRGQNIIDARTRKLRRMGLIYVPGSREARGLALGASVADNLLAVDVARGKSIKREARGREVASRADRFKFPNRPWAPAYTLSGGNHSRLIYGREFSQAGDLAVFSRPYLGLDDGAIEAARSCFAELRRRGATIVTFSQDPDEILDLADTLVVPEAGARARVVPLQNASIDDVRGYLSGRDHGGTT